MHIDSSALVAAIRGGNREVPRDGMVVLDASLSHDPDAVARGEVSRNAQEPSMLLFSCGSTPPSSSPRPYPPFMMVMVMMMASARAITMAAAAA